MRILKFMALMLIAAMAAGCSSHRQATSKENSTASRPTTSEQQRVQGILDSYGNWTDLRMPVTLNLNEPTQISLNGTLTMERDRSIQLSFRFLGLEMLNLRLTNDSIYGWLRTSKIYMAERTDALLGNFPVTVGNLQSLLTGRIFEVGKAAPVAADMTISPTPSKGLSIAMPEAGGMGYAFAIDATNALTLLSVTPRGASAVACRYGAPYTSAWGPVATSASVNAAAGGTRIDLMLELNARKVTWNSGAKTEWKVPAGYKKVRASEIVKLLGR